MPPKKGWAVQLDLCIFLLERKGCQIVKLSDLWGAGVHWYPAAVATVAIAIAIWAV